MRKHATLILASAFVAVSASAVLAEPGFPGNQSIGYQATNQSYDWQANNGATMQPGHSAYAAAKHHRAAVTADQPDPWQKARIDDTNEAPGS